MDGINIEFVGERHPSLQTLHLKKPTAFSYAESEYGVRKRKKVKHIKGRETQTFKAKCPISFRITLLLILGPSKAYSLIFTESNEPLTVEIGKTKEYYFITASSLHFR